MTQPVKTLATTPNDLGFILETYAKVPGKNQLLNDVPLTSEPLCPFPNGNDGFHKENPVHPV